MLPASYPWLWLIPFAPVLVASLSFPAAERAPRGVIIGVGFTAWLASSVTAVLALLRELDMGGYARVAQVGFQGVRLRASISAPVPLHLEGTPLSLLVAVAVAVVGFALLLASISAHGGGARREHRPSTSAAFLAQLLALGFLQWAILSPSLAVLVTALVVTSLLGTALLLSERPRARELDGALLLFALHRAGDAAAALALCLMFAAFGRADPGVLASPQGELLGVGGPELARVITWLWLGAAASRLSPLGVPAFFRDAIGAPAPTVALFHGVVGFGLAVWIALQTSVYWDPSTFRAVALVAAGTALFAAARAAITHHAVRADLHLLQALAALAVLSLAIGCLEAGVLGLLLVLAFTPALLLPTAAVIEANHGRTSLLDFGGLMRPLRGSDFARGIVTVALLAAPLSPLYLFGERVAFEALAGPRHHAGVTALTLGALFLVGFAGFRAFHLTFAGDKPRGPAPAILLDASWPRRAVQTLLAFALLLAPLITTVQPWIVSLLVDEYREPLLFFLQPHLVELSPYQVTVGGLPVAPSRLRVDALARYQLTVGLAVLALVGYGLSRALYRNRPESPARATEPAATALDVVEGGLGLEGRLVRGLIALGLIVAVAARTLVFNFLLDGVITRVTGGLVAIVRAVSRLVHNGDAQRSLAVVLLVLAVVLYVWGRA